MSNCHVYDHYASKEWALGATTTNELCDLGVATNGGLRVANEFLIRSDAAVTLRFNGTGTTCPAITVAANVPLTLNGPQSTQLYFTNAATSTANVKVFALGAKVSPY